MTTVLCVNCVFYKSYNIDEWCMCPSTAKINMVSGPMKITCHEARNTEHSCGLNAQYFVPRKIKRSWFDRLWND